jgi:GNAT superfamily N-acetyltransferase
MSILVKTTWSLRLAREADVPALENLIALSSRGLRANYYSAAQIEGALGSVFGVDRQLIRDATYFAVESPPSPDSGVARDSQLIGCGGWSKRKTLFGSDHQTGRDDAELDATREPARIRAFFVHPDWARRGIGQAILDACEKAIREAGFSSIELAATLPGEPFYAAFKYSALERYDVPLTNGLSLPVVQMRKYLTPK